MLNVTDATNIKPISKTLTRQDYTALAWLITTREPAWTDLDVVLKRIHEATAAIPGLVWC